MVVCVLCLLIAVPLVYLWSVSVAFPGHTDLFFFPDSSITTEVVMLSKNQFDRYPCGDQQNYICTG